MKDGKVNSGVGGLAVSHEGNDAAAYAVAL